MFGGYSHLHAIDDKVYLEKKLNLHIKKLSRLNQMYLIIILRLYLVFIGKLDLDLDILHHLNF